MKNLKKSLISTSIVMAFSSSLAQANTVTGPRNTNNNFTMLYTGSVLVSGTNDITFTWDGTLNTDPATAVSNATIVSATPTFFFGSPWTAYEIKTYGPGNYTIPTADISGEAGCPFGLSRCASGGDYQVTINSGQVMAHMKFAWDLYEGIDIVNVWQSGSWTTLNSTVNSSSPIWTGPGGTYIGPEYDFVSTDWDGDSFAGGNMIDGPFPIFSANFNVNIPLPASVWLFGSGLVGLFGLMRRRVVANRSLK